MPPAITGPAEPNDPPLAGTPLTVSKSRTALNVQITFPSGIHGAQDSVPSAGEDDSRNGAGRTSLSAPVGVDGGVPIHLAGLNVKRLQAAAGLLQRVVDAGAIGGAAPDHQAGTRRGRVVPQLGPPQELALVIGIERDRHAAFSRSQQEVLAVDSLQNGGGTAEVVVRPKFVRTVGAGAGWSPGNEP